MKGSEEFREIFRNRSYLPPLKFISQSSECRFGSGVLPLVNQFLHFLHACNQILKLEAKAVFCISQYWQSCCKYPRR